MFAVKQSSSFADESAHRSDDIHALLWERIHSRKLYPGRRQCVGCAGPFADESAPTDSMIFTRYCGSEFVRESFISDAANVLDVLAPSRMNPLPQIR
jgi:hypothetical protein